MSDLISRKEALTALRDTLKSGGKSKGLRPVTFEMIWAIKSLPSAEPEIIRCKDCKYWRQQTNYAGIRLSFGFCESDNMWRSLYGETVEVDHIDTDDDFYCGYAERRTDE